MHVVRRDRVVEVGDAELFLDLLDTGLGRYDGLLLFVNLVVNVTSERPRDGRELVVELGDVRRRTRDDERVRASSMRIESTSSTIA